MIVNNNGILVEDISPLFSVQHRGVRYGDGLFETMAMHQANPILAHSHYERLSRSAESLKMILPFTFAQFLSEIKKTGEANRLENARVRVSIYRASGGLYTPLSNTTEYVIEALPLHVPLYEMNTQGCRLGDYTDMLKPIHPLSAVKTTSSVFYVLAALWKKENGWDDCILYNTSNQVVETSVCNLFYVADGIVYTPPLSSGCLDGVMRRHVIDLCKEAGVVVVEQETTPSHLLNADEIFLTNAIQGIQWVGEYAHMTYAHRVSSLLSKSLMAGVR